MSKLSWERSVPMISLESLYNPPGLTRPFAGSSAGQARQPSLPPLRHGRVDFEALYAMGGVVIDAVPEEQRGKYRYWRGAHLGRIATNFARGAEKLNAGSDLVVHVTEKRPTAIAWANYNTKYEHSRQFTAADRAELAAFTGRSRAEPLPGIVFALDESFNDVDLLFPLAMGGSNEDDDGGVVYDGVLTTAMIDPYSRAVIEDLRLHQSGE